MAHLTHTSPEDDRMSVEEFTVSLRVFHPASSHRDISSLLGMEADIGYTVGEQRSTPKGGLLDGVNQQTYCCFILIPKSPGNFAEHINELMLNLLIYRDFFRSVVDAGGRSELFVGVFSESSTGFTLGTADMSKLSEASLDLSIEVYLSS